MRSSRTLERSPATPDDGTAGARDSPPRWKGNRAEPRQPSPGASGPARATVGAPALLAVALAIAFPFSPGYSTHDDGAQAVAALVVAAVAVCSVPWAVSVSGSSAGDDRSLAGQVRLAAAVLSAATAAIHLAVVKMHFAEYVLFGLFFVGTGIVQLAWGLGLVLRPSRGLLAAGAVGNVIIAALWAVDRMWGLPLGPDRWMPDPVGFADSVTSAFEVLLALCCSALLATRPFRALQQRRAGVAARPALIVVVATLTALSLLSVAGVAPSLLPPTA